MKGEIHIVLDGSNMTVSAPVAEPATCLFMIGRALEAIGNQLQQQSGLIVAPAPLPPAKLVSRN